MEIVAGNEKPLRFVCAEGCVREEPWSEASDARQDFVWTDPATGARQVLRVEDGGLSGVGRHCANGNDAHCLSQAEVAAVPDVPPPDTRVFVRAADWAQLWVINTGRTSPHPDPV